MCKPTGCGRAHGSVESACCDKTSCAWGKRVLSSRSVPESLAKSLTLVSMEATLAASEPNAMATPRCKQKQRAQLFLRSMLACSMVRWCLLCGRMCLVCLLYPGVHFRCASYIRVYISGCACFTRVDISGWACMGDGTRVDISGWACMGDGEAVWATGEAVWATGRLYGRRGGCMGDG